ncbi:hypothetical protein ACWDV4_22310 [Micromonospora sp. NPDC003197]
MTKISPHLPDYIRTLVRGENEANERVQAQLDSEGWDGFPKFLATVFFLAVDRRFGEEATRAEVIRFVAELRADLSHGGPELSAEAAESLIAATIDPALDYDIEPNMIGRIQASTVYKILSEENMTDEDLNALLAESMQLASRP